MQFYQFEYKLKDEGPEVKMHREWHPSERDAVVSRMKLFKAGKLHGRKKDNPIWPVDVPTRKADLLEFLRRECV